MKHISSIKPNVEKGLYGLVKRPDAKTPDLSELSKTIKKFQDAPDINFTSKLRKRVPSNNSYKLESKDDFGLSKRFKSGSLTKVENPDASAKIVDGRFSDKIKPFKISKGITGLNKQFEKVIPKTDYSYTDPQFYEYKLKGQTIKDQQLSAFKNQNEDDIDKLDIQGKYKKWREEELGNKATKIQKLFRGRSVREDLGEGMKHIDRPEVEEGFEQVDFQKPIKGIKDVITAGKAKRKEKMDENLYNKKAIKIQKAFRGKNGRVEANNLKEENENRKYYRDFREREGRERRLNDVIQYAEDSRIAKIAKNYDANQRKEVEKMRNNSDKMEKGFTRLAAKVRGNREKAYVKPHLDNYREANPEKYKLSEYDTVKLELLRRRGVRNDAEKADLERRENEYEEAVKQAHNERQALE